MGLFGPHSVDMGGQVKIPAQGWWPKLQSRSLFYFFLFFIFIFKFAGRSERPAQRVGFRSTPPEPNCIKVYDTSKEINRKALFKLSGGLFSLSVRPPFDLKRAAAVSFLCMCVGILHRLHPVAAVVSSPSPIPPQPRPWHPCLFPV
jgi:hypothetical protein